MLVTGTGAEVEGVVPEGRRPDVRALAVATLERADIVSLDGLGPETPTQRTAVANLADRSEVCELGTTVLHEEDDIFDCSFPEDGGVPNPHLWTALRAVPGDPVPASAGGG